MGQAKVGERDSEREFARCLIYHVTYGDLSRRASLLSTSNSWAIITAADKSWTRRNVSSHLP